MISSVFLKLKFSSNSNTLSVDCDLYANLHKSLKSLTPSTSIDLAVQMTIPEDYVRDTNLRMGIYRRLGSGSEPGEQVLAELRDRFGPPPRSVVTLASVADLKRLAESLRVQSISARRGKLVIRLRQDARVDIEALIRYVSELEAASFSPSGVLSLPTTSPPQALQLAHDALQAMSPA